MKTRFMTYMSTLLAVAMISNSCVREELECENAAWLHVDLNDGGSRVKPSKNITYAVIYLFDAKSREFLDSVTLSSAQIDGNSDVMLKHNANGLIAVFWGNVDSRGVVRPEVYRGSRLEDVSIKLRRNTRGYDPLVPKIFYGIQKIPAGSLRVNNMRVGQVAAGVRVTLTGIVKWGGAGVDDNSFSVVIRNTGSEISFDNVVVENNAIHRPVLTMGGDDLIKTSVVSSVFPSMTDRPVVIDVYHKDLLVLSIDRDANGIPLVAESGKIMDVRIDFANKENILVEVPDRDKQEIF